MLKQKATFKERRLIFKEAPKNDFSQREKLPSTNNVKPPTIDIYGTTQKRLIEGANETIKSLEKLRSKIRNLNDFIVEGYNIRDKIEQQGSLSNLADELRDWQYKAEILIRAKAKKEAELQYKKRRIFIKSIIEDFDHFAEEDPNLLAVAMLIEEGFDKKGNLKNNIDPEVMVENFASMDYLSNNDKEKNEPEKDSDSKSNLSEAELMQLGKNPKLTPAELKKIQTAYDTGKKVVFRGEATAEPVNLQNLPHGKLQKELSVFLRLFHQGRIKIDSATINFNYENLTNIIAKYVSGFKTTSKYPEYDTNSLVNNHKDLFSNIIFNLVIAFRRAVYLERGIEDEGIIIPGDGPYHLVLAGTKSAGIEIEKNPSNEPQWLTSVRIATERHPGTFVKEVRGPFGSEHLYAVTPKGQLFSLPNAVEKLDPKSSIYVCNNKDDPNDLTNWIPTPLEALDPEIKEIIEIEIARKMPKREEFLSSL